jgi:hypothetical protein
MSPRGRRGAAAALLASRMTEEIEIDDDEREEIDGLDAGADDEPEPEIEDDGADEDTAPDYSHIEPEPDPEPEVPTDALDDLQRQLAELRGQNEALSKQAERGEAAELAADQAHVVGALNAAKAELARGRADYEAASAAGKWSVAAAAQEKMALAAADLREYEGALDEVKAAITRFNKGERRAQPAASAAVPTDQFEAAISTMGDKSKEWCRKNKADLQKSPARGQRAVTAHLEAVEAGHKVDTPEYFKFLDKQMGYETVTTTTRKPKPTGQARVAAPGGSRSAPPRGGSITEVKLSAAEVATARALGMTTKEYAANKRELIQNGKDASRSGPRYSEQSHANRR